MKDLCRRHGFSEASYELWRNKFGGLEVSDAKRLKTLEQENAGRGGAGTSGDPRGAPKKVVGAPARRGVVPWMSGRGLTERHALQVIGMSAGSVRYCPAPDWNADLQQTIVALAHRHRRYGVGMMYLKVCQQGSIGESQVD